MYMHSKQPSMSFMLWITLFSMAMATQYQKLMTTLLERFLVYQLLCGLLGHVHFENVVVLGTRKENLAVKNM